MNMIIAYALLGGGVAGAVSGLVWLARRYGGLGEKGQKYGNIAAIIFAVIAVRVVPIDDLVQASSQSDAVDRVAQTIPPLQVIKELYPADYAAIKAAALQAGSGGGSEVEIMNRIRPMYLAVFERQAKKAGDENLNRLLDIAIQQGKVLQSINPQFCNEMLNAPTRLSFNPANVLPRDLLNAEFAVIADVLRETVSAPEISVQALSGQDAERWAMKALDGLTDAEAAVISRPNYDLTTARTPLEHNAGCAFTLGMLEAVAEGPAAENAQQFRAIMAAT